MTLPHLRSGVVLLAAFVLVAALPAAADFVNPPEYVGPIDAYHAKATRRWICAASVAVAPNGRLWATWFTGKTPSEDANSFVILVTSADNGATWTEVQCVDPDREGIRRAYDPQVWVDPAGDLHWFWSDGNRLSTSTLGVWEANVGDACTPFAKMSKPRVVGGGIMLGDPLVLSDGAWGLPISSPGCRRGVGLWVSEDRGTTWRWRGGADCPDLADRVSNEHCIVEKRDGTLWTIVRRRKDIGQAFSKDLGRTWTDVKPFEVKCTNTRVWLSKLKSGNFILVKNGPIDQDVGRERLTAYLSRDEGRTWEGGLLIDARGGATYPNGAQGPDGLISLVHDISRKDSMQVLLSQFTEEDVLTGKNVSGRVRLLDNINGK